MLRKASEAGISSRSFVNSTVAVGPNWSSPCNLVLAKVTEERLVGFARQELNEIGDRRNSKDQAFDASEGWIDECLSINSTKRFCVRGSFEGSGGSSERGMGAKLTRGSFMSSRTSLIVKAAWRRNQSGAEHWT